MSLSVTAMVSQMLEALRQKGRPGPLAIPTHLEDLAQHTIGEVT